MSAYFRLRQRAMARRFWGYALPSVMAMLVSGAYYLVDGIFVGHYVGAAGLPASTWSIRSSWCSSASPP